MTPITEVITEIMNVAKSGEIGVIQKRIAIGHLIESANVRVCLQGVEERMDAAANAALTGILSNYQAVQDIINHTKKGNLAEAVAHQAYGYARAMMVERQKGEDNG